MITFSAVILANTRLVKASPTVIRAPDLALTKPFTGCSPMAVADPTYNEPKTCMTSLKWFVGKNNQGRKPVDYLLWRNEKVQSRRHRQEGCAMAPRIAVEQPIRSQICQPGAKYRVSSQTIVTTVDRHECIDPPSFSRIKACASQGG